MGDYLAKTIGRLQSLPDGTHWFCPRHGTNDERNFYPEDLQTKPAGHDIRDPAVVNGLLTETGSRKSLFQEALRIFAFTDALPYQQWLEQAISQQMQQCDVCVREYHRGREELRESLLRQRYDEDEVKSFLEVIDNMDRRRIQRGLERATARLRSLPSQERVARALAPEELYAIFETLSSIVILRDQDFLAAYFDEPFKLVQENKTLKLSSVTPGMAFFVFQKNQDRRWWALQAWAKLKRIMTAKDFECSVKPALDEAMLRVQLQDLDRPFLPLFWAGVRSFVEKLDQSLITHSLRAMEIDICKLALDHLQIDSVAFKDLLASMTKILVVSPLDFWGAMGTIPASTWIDQFFSSAALKRLLSPTRMEKDDSRALMEQLFSWILPFISSIRAINQASVCRHLASQLMDRFQKQDDPEMVRRYTYGLGLEVLASTLQTLASGDSSSGGPSVAEVLDTVDDHIDHILALDSEDGDVSSKALGVVRWSLALDCKCVCQERKALKDKELLPQAKAYAGRASIWQAVAKGIQHKRNMVLGRTVLIAVRELVGLERFVAKNAEVSQSRENWNQAFDTVNVLVMDLLEQINGCDPADIQTIFDDQEATNALVANLFSSDLGVRDAAMDVFKNVSEKTIRQEALGDALRTYLPEVLTAFSLAFRRISFQKTFAATSNMLRVGKDVLEILCNATDGAMRITRLSVQDKRAAETFWQAMWHELATIFKTTEDWSNDGRPKDQMMVLVADTIEYARYAVDQIAVFTGALSGVDEQQDDRKTTESRLISEPKNSMNEMVKWLRLKDDSLLSKATELICNLLRRLKGLQARTSEETMYFIEDVLMGKTKSLLNNTRKAELQSALEFHIGEPIKFEDDNVKPKMERVKPAKGNQQLDLVSWAQKSQAAPPRKNEALQKVVAASSKGHDALQKRSDLAGRKALLGAPHRPEMPRPSDSSDFKKQRDAELAAKKKRDLEIIASTKRRVTGKNANEGSGVLGLGNIGKIHSKAKGTGIMISSDESSTEDDDDLELFGPSKKTAKNQAGSTAYDEARAKNLLAQKAKGPVKKQRIVRTAQDMRARLAPNLSPLHESILGWDFFHDGPFPPKSSAQDYAEVLSRFRDPISYQQTFQPLLLLEAWNGFLKAREELQTKPYEVKVAGSTNVDMFVEVNTTVSVADGKELSEGDIILLSKHVSPADKKQEPHCLARIQQIRRKKAHAEVLYRALPGSSLMSTLALGASIFGLKVMSIIPLEREYGALRGLEYYDLCDEITKGKPSPLLNYTDIKLNPLMDNYKVNKAQAKAIQSALDNDAFTLVQGPPGSGKTKTIVAIVGALLTESLRNTSLAIGPATTGVTGGSRPLATKKLLVCAPSNAAVDELVMRFKEGIKILNGEERKVSIVRLGRSDAINTNVQDVTLDELINKRLNISAEKDNTSVETRKIMDEHQTISHKFNEAHAALKEAEKQKENTSILTALRKEIEELGRSKKLYGRKVDEARDAEKAQSVRAEAHRRKVQQEIIEGAHIICATLSGSGHDMFQSLSVEFETVVIDEAAQCVELSALIPLKYGCAKCVLVGDPQQLPPTVFSKEAARFKYEQSLFVRMQGNHPDDVHLLDTQYRMHPEISAFPREAFYQSKLVDGPNMAALRTREWHAAELLGPFRFFDVQGQHESSVRGHSLINRAEIRVAIQLYRRLQADFWQHDFKGKIGVITPYKSQLRELKDQFKRTFGPSIADQVEFNTTDAFQGRESEIIIFSCVRASPGGGIGFLQDIRRMNVGLTRAKSSLWVLGSSQSLQKGEYWNKLIVHAQKSGHFTQGNIEGILQRPSKLIKNVDDMLKQAKLDIANGTTSSAAPTPDAMDVDSGPLEQPPKGDAAKPEAKSHQMSGRAPIRDAGSEAYDVGTQKRKMSREDSEQPIKKKAVAAEADNNKTAGSKATAASGGGTAAETKSAVVPQRGAVQRRPAARPQPESVFVQPKRKRRE